jgi:hypothetical protein
MSQSCDGLVKILDQHIVDVRYVPKFFEYFAKRPILLDSIPGVLDRFRCNAPENLEIAKHIGNRKSIKFYKLLQSLPRGKIKFTKALVGKILNTLVKAGIVHKDSENQYKLNHRHFNL